MQKIKTTVLAASLSLFLISCGDSTKPELCIDVCSDTAIISSNTVLQSSNGQVVYSSAAIIPQSSASTASGFALLPAIGNPAYVDGLYQTWKTMYVVNQEAEAANALAGTAGTARIKWDTQSYTVSEAIGYGMLNAYFQKDFDLFNKLWGYGRAFRASGYYLTPWKIQYFIKASDITSATDAEFDIATALVLAYLSTGNEVYKNDALKMINDIWGYEVISGTLMIRPSDSGFKDQYNCSYFSPVAFRLFAMVDPTHDWMSVLNVGYAYMNTVQAGGNGLFADWTNGAGVPTIPQNNLTSTSYHRYGLESIRIPWRMAWDYHWFGEPRAKAILDKMANYITVATAGDPTAVLSNYPFLLSDAEAGIIWSQGNKKRIGTVASTCAMGVANPNYANYVAACTNLLNTTPIDPSFVNYFHHILQVMYAQFLNGMYIKPAVIP